MPGENENNKLEELRKIKGEDSMCRERKEAFGGNKLMGAMNQWKAASFRN